MFVAQTMGIQSAWTFILFIFCFANANSKKNCESTDWVANEVELKCPVGMKEIYEYRFVPDSVHAKICCIPGTAEETLAHKSVQGCEQTGCANSPTNSCSLNMYQRIYNGKLLSYEEIHRKECTTYEGGPGWTFFLLQNKFN